MDRIFLLLILPGPSPLSNNLAVIEYDWLLFLYE